MLEELVKPEAVFLGQEGGQFNLWLEGEVSRCFVGFEDYAFGVEEEQRGRVLFYDVSQFYGGMGHFGWLLRRG